MKKAAWLRDSCLIYKQTMKEQVKLKMHGHKKMKTDWKKENRKNSTGKNRQYDEWDDGNEPRHKKSRRDFIQFEEDDFYENKKWK